VDTLVLSVLFGAASSHSSLNSLFQIGVGAIFIVTLAQSRLEAPQNPPQSQQDILATVLQPIVSFVVLGSILTHGLSIPFFSIGRHTLTMSRSLVDQPDWLLGVRRVPPQEDPEHVVTKVTKASVDIAEEPLREGQQRVEWPDLPNLPDSAHDGVVTRKKILRIDDAGPSTSSRQSIDDTKQKRVEIVTHYEAGPASQVS